ncbi:MAG: MMPL family transporter [Eubacterium sp.]|nr:MMPL family transporter [Eubacterium sp.]
MIAKHRVLIILLAVILLIPAGIGFIMTKVNYDVLSYLPDSLDTVHGQDVMVDEFGMGAFSMIVVEGMEKKDVQKLEKDLEEVDHVKEILWYDDVVDITLPVEMIPEKLRTALFNGDATMMIALFDDTTSKETTMDAISNMREIVADHAFIGGMSAIVTDIKGIALQEMPIYVAVAVVLTLIILLLTMDSFVTGFLFLAGIGMAVVYNMGTNIFMGQISYLTQAVAAVLQLGVTMDYSIFLLESYRENKERYPGDNQRAMAHAIANALKSVTSSSITTIAGFMALCFMTFGLGMDMGIVMAKGVVFGVIVCVTFLPALVLCCDKAIEKTSHRSLMPKFDKISKGINKGWLVLFILFLVILPFAWYGNTHYHTTYSIADSLPQDLDSAVANKKLEDTFNMETMHIVMLPKDMESKDIKQLNKEINGVKGVKWVLGMSELVGEKIPDAIIPEEINSKLVGDEHEIEFICSEYKNATDEVIAQVGEVQDIVKKYNDQAVVIGEAPLIKDLRETTVTDIRNVNIVSIGFIFLIIMITFRSILLPVILVAVIEFAILINMGLPFYMGDDVSFVASIVIGTIQMGSTVDYAILMTSRYQKERLERHKSKKEAISIAHSASIKSIITSGLIFFAATFGVAVVTNIDLIDAICSMLARGAVISTIAVILFLPAMFMVFDKLICKLTWSMRKIDW